MAGTISLSTMQNTLSPVVKKAYNEGVKSMDIYYPEFVNVLNSKEYYYEALEVSQLGLLSQISDMEDMPKLDSSLGSVKQYVPITFAGRISASRLAAKFDGSRLNIIRQWANGLGKMAKKTPDVQINTYLEDGDDTATTPDGAFLFSTTHTNLAGGTYANRPVSYSEFSYTALDTAYAAMKKTKRHGVVAGNNEPRYILHDSTLDSKVHAVLNSLKVPGGGDNDSNYYYKRLKSISCPLFTSTKIWILLTEKDMHSLNLIFWTVAEMYKWIKQSNQEMNWAIVSDYNYGAVSGLGLYGQNPA
jgi:hypothetical protein